VVCGARVAYDELQCMRMERDNKRKSLENVEVASILGAEIGAI